MSLISPAEQQQIAELIREVERHTNAELVTVLAARSDDYRYIPVLWAALVSLALAPALLFTPLSAELIVAIQLGAFCVLALLLRLPGLAIRLIPRSVRHWRAANMARRQFLEQGLHHTAGDTGVLLFVSEAEHYVEILADRGVDRHVPPERWRGIVAEFVDAVRAGQTLSGFERAINAIGEILADAVPKTPDNRNELDDRLILIGYDRDGG
ncbi:MAG TPA: TPM domain-containing protein [Pseudomonadales bacterium]